MSGVKMQPTNANGVRPSTAFVPVANVDPATGLAIGSTSYQLASNQSLASGANTIAVTGVQGRSYAWDVQGVFAGGSTVSLQYLKADGVTWAIAAKTDGTPATMSASGIMGVFIGNNAAVRLVGGVATTTALYSTLS